MIAEALKRVTEQIADAEDKIQDLSLDGVHIEQITPEIKEKIEKLQLFTLSFNDCALKSLDNLPKIQNLGRLELAKNDFPPNELTKILDCFPNLAVLVLSDTKIDKFEDVTCLASLQDLFELDLSKTPLSKKKNYRERVFELVPPIGVLDGFDDEGKPFEFADDEKEVEQERDDDAYESNHMEEEEDEDEEEEEDDEEEEVEDDEEEPDEDVEAKNTKKKKVKK